MTDSWAKERAKALLDSWWDKYRLCYDTDLVSEAEVYAALVEAEKRFIARLRNPDEALVEAVAKATSEAAIMSTYKQQAEIIIRALADALEAEQTGVLPIVQGGTGAQTADDLIAEMKALKEREAETG